MNSNLPANPPVVRERGGCLTLWLVVSFGLYIYAGIAICQLLGQLQNPRVPLNTIPSGLWAGLILRVILAGAGLPCLIGIWNWKRWGVYGVVILEFVGIFIPSTTPSDGSRELLSFLIRMVILGAMLWDKWKYFE